MTTTSFPSWGTLLIALAFLGGVLSLVTERFPFFGKRRPQESKPELARGGARHGRALRAAATTAVIALVLVAIGCTPPQATAEARTDVAELRAGEACAYCDGTIGEARFGGRLTTVDGESYRFMSVECLAGFVLEERVPSERVATLEVVDYSHGKRLIDATTASYVRMQFERSPNGLNLAAVATERVAGTLHYFHGGERMDWARVLDYVRTEWKL